MTSVPSLPALQHSQMLHAIDLCRASSKFSLPDGGQLFQDSELRALDEKSVLRLPFPFIALEYRATRENIEETDMSTLCSRRILFVREGDEGIHITPAVCLDANGIWILMSECVLPSVDYLDRSNMKQDRVYIRMNFPHGADPRDYQDEVTTVLSFLNAIQCSNVHTERVQPKRQGKKIKSALPFDTYHILTVDLPASVNSGCANGSHRSPREHLRRGHIVRPGLGRRPYWRNATVVCAGRGLGKVTKDYLIRSRFSPVNSEFGDNA